MEKEERLYQIDNQLRAIQVQLRELHKLYYALVVERTDIIEIEQDNKI